MNTLKLIFLLFVGYCANSISIVNGSCADVQSIPLNQLGPLFGEPWYLSGQTTSVKGCNAIIFTNYNYPYVSYTVTENFDGSNSGEITVFISNNTLVISNPDNPTFQPNYGPLVSFSYQIVHTNYLTYFLAYSCAEDSGTSYLFTSESNLSPDQFSSIQNKLNQAGLPDKVLNVEPTDCVMSSGSSSASSSAGS